MTLISTRKRVCFISARTGWVKGNCHVRMDMANAKLIEALAEKLQCLSLGIVDKGRSSPSFDYSLKVQRVYSLPTPFSYIGGVMNSFRFYHRLRKISDENDILIVQLPFIGFLSLLFLRKPVVYHVCANVLTAAANPVKYKGIGRLISGSFAWFMHKVHRNIFDRSGVKILTNGEELYFLYKAFSTQMVISSSIKNDDIRSDETVVVSNQPLKLLFVGRPSLEKGFDVLIMALMTLQLSFTLTVVGFAEREFQQLLPGIFKRSKQMRERLRFKGYVGWDQGLREIMRESDLAIVPSRSEGTPRVVLECMSQGVAVIASRLGGIPSIIKHGVNGLLAEPGSSRDIAEKIVMLNSDLDYRKRLILQGLRTARMNTVDHFAEQFHLAIKEILND